MNKERARRRVAVVAGSFYTTIFTHAVTEPDRLCLPKWPILYRTGRKWRCQPSSKTVTSLKKRPSLMWIKKHFGSLQIHSFIATSNGIFYFQSHSDIVSWNFSSRKLLKKMGPGCIIRGGCWMKERKWRKQKLHCITSPFLGNHKKSLARRKPRYIFRVACCKSLWEITVLEEDGEFLSNKSSA